MLKTWESQENLKKISRKSQENLKKKILEFFPRCQPRDFWENRWLQPLVFSEKIMLVTAFGKPMVIRLETRVMISSGKRLRKMLVTAFRKLMIVWLRKTVGYMDGKLMVIWFRKTSLIGSCYSSAARVGYSFPNATPITSGCSFLIESGYSFCYGFLMGLVIESGYSFCCGFLMGLVIASVNAMWSVWIFLLFVECWLMLVIGETFRVDFSRKNLKRFRVSYSLG